MFFVRVILITIHCDAWYSNGGEGVFRAGRWLEDSVSKVRNVHELQWDGYKLEFKIYN